MSSSATPPEVRAAIKQRVREGPFGRKKRPETQFPLPRWEVLSKARCKYFFEYWATKIPKSMLDLVYVSVYRTWPQVKMELVEPERKDHAWEVIEGACPFDPENFETQIMQRPGYGSGDYRFDLKERGLSDILCRAYVSAQDLHLYPPVLDYSTLVNTPANQSYIRDLMKLNVKLPWEYTPEEDEMAGNAMGDAMKTMADAVVTISKTAVEQANSAKESAEAEAEARVEAAEAEAQAQEPGQTPEGTVQVVTAIGNMYANAAKGVVDMVTQHAGHQFNPVEMLTAAKQLMGDGGTMVMLDKMSAMQEKNLAFLEKVMESKTKESSAVAVPVAPANGLDQLLDQAEKLKRLADVMGWSHDNDREPAPPERPPKAPEKSLGAVISENIVPIVGGLTSILALGANILYNMKAAQPRNPAEDLATAAKANPLQQMMPQSPNGTGIPTVPPANPDDPLAQYRPFVGRVAPAFLAHFFDPNFSGYTFAEYILSGGSGAGNTPEGRQAYGTIKETLGRQKFDQLIRESDLWSRIQGMPQKYAKFLDEFFGYDEWAEQQAKQEAMAS